MRCIFKTLLTVGSLFLAACAHGQERFILTARLLPPRQQSAVPRLGIDLHNISDQPQQVITLTNLFEGRVYLRDTRGEVHEFVQTNYWNLMISAFFVPPTLELAPGTSFYFEHPLSEFMDSERMRMVQVGNSPDVAFPMLSAEFQRGCAIWCALDIYQWKKLDDRHTTGEKTAIVVTTPLKHPQ